MITMDAYDYKQDIRLLTEYIGSKKIKYTDEYEESYMVKKSKRVVLSRHDHKITPPPHEGGYWSTYVTLPDEKGRHKVTAPSENSLITKLFQIYFIEQGTTIESLFPEWMNLRREEGVSAQTMHRNQNYWDKYYKNDPIVKKSLSTIKPLEIEHFFYSLISKFNLTAKELGNIKIIAKEVLRLAYRKGLIETNPFVDVVVKTTGCKPPIKYKKASRVYLPDEKKALFAYLNEALKKNPNNTDIYAIFVLFKLGLRLGELVALRWEDIDGDTIHIQRTESKVEDNNGKLYEAVVEHTKKKSIYGDRFLPLDEYLLNIFDNIKSINQRCSYNDEGGYIFCDERGRTNKRSIDNLIRKACKALDIEVRSAHDIRRTVASEMMANGVDVKIIQNFLGHSDLQTTFAYIYDNRSEMETKNIIINALKTMEFTGFSH